MIIVIDCSNDFFSPREKKIIARGTKRSLKEKKKLVITIKVTGTSK